MSDMMGGCKNGGGNCGKLDCAWGCAIGDDPSRYVPTAVVPRRTPLSDMRANIAAFENQLLAPDPPPGQPMRGLAGLYTADTYPYESDRRVIPMADVDPIQQAIDRQLEIERKARAWDALRAFVEGPGYAPGIAAQMDNLLT